MIVTLILKELKDYFKSKTSLLYFLFLIFLSTYGFYSAIDLYSKASLAAVNNPLYATGFEPIQGVFVPTFGSLFIILSLIAPFMFIQTIAKEKNSNTIVLSMQMRYSFFTYFTAKIFAALIMVLLSLLTFLPMFLFWHFAGGHIAIGETLNLFLGYFLYALVVISISFFASSVFTNNSQASIFALALIMLSWFLDFGRDMNILPFIDKISSFSISATLKLFENGILSLQAVLYLTLLALYLLFLSYLFFNISIRRKTKAVIIATFIFMILILSSFVISRNYDITESKRNSFSPSKNRFVKKLPHLKIKIYLEKTDSRAKDYENDFLKKLRMIKSDITVTYASKEEMQNHYGYFLYRIKDKSEETLSNSEEEIFMVLQDISGIKIDAKENEVEYSGYPLIVKSSRLKPLLIFYLIILPLIIFGIFYIINIRKRSYDEKDI